jgi:hypothetical protein
VTIPLKTGKSTLALCAISSQIFSLIQRMRKQGKKGTDIFRVIMTVFGVESTKGDVVAIVTVNNGEASRMKFLETEAFKPVSSNLTSLTYDTNSC